MCRIQFRRKRKGQTYIYFLCILVLCLIPYYSTNLNLYLKQVALPYYKWQYKFDYEFVDMPNYRGVLSQREQLCSPVNSGEENEYVDIEGEVYPKRIPLYLDRRLNFTCLNQETTGRVKTILLWNKFAGEPLFPYDEGIREPFIKHTCPVTNCELTSDRHKLDKSDYILFHMRSRIDTFPARRYNWQRWIYTVYESPQHCPMCHRFNGIFNLSATYKTDSDFTSLYLTDAGVQWTSVADESKASRDYFSGKKHFSYIMSSSCDALSGRLEYIDELKKYIEVDSYGACSKIPGLQCTEPESCDKKQLSQKYLFYFAMENSVCNEYITEKFLDVVYNHDTIPVVLGGPGHDFYAPKSAFINVLDYSGPEQLANYLLYLSKNRTAYNQYFQWKRFIRPLPTIPFQAHLCEMCIQLNLEKYQGFKYGHIKDPLYHMSAQENCQQFTQHTENGLRKIKWVKPSRLNQLKMKNIESPYT